MYAIYLVDRVYGETGYLSVLKRTKEIIRDEEIEFNKPTLAETPIKSYTTYAKVENRCRQLPDLLKRFRSDGTRYGWGWKNIYDIYIADIESNTMNKIISADLKDESPLHEDVRLGLHGYY